MTGEILSRANGDVPRSAQDACLDVCPSETNRSEGRLTFKSIETILKECLAAGTLKPFTPLLDADERIERHLYVTKTINDFLYGNHASKRDSDYYASVRAALGDFVKGEHIEDDGIYLKKLKAYSEEIWEFRILLTPQSRVFGAFAGHNQFIALAAAFRGACDNGGFEVQKELVKGRWAELFGGHRRYSCYPLKYCISNVGEI